MRGRLAHHFDPTPSDCLNDGFGSWFDGISRHPSSDSWPEVTFGHHIDFTPQQVPQIHHESTQVEQSPRRLEVDEEVDIAAPAVITTSHRAEHPDMSGATRAGYSEDLLAALPQFSQRH